MNRLEFKESHMLIDKCIKRMYLKRCTNTLVSFYRWTQKDNLWISAVKVY